ncbi:hypothetical protein BST61_g7211 [Cercospora zeina]
MDAGIAMGKVPSASAFSLWLQNMESQRQTGAWVGGPPFKLDSTPLLEAILFVEVQKQNEFQLPMRPIQGGPPKALGTKVDARTKLVQGPQDRPPEADISSLDGTSSKVRRRKIERQKERRREKRQHGSQWQGKRDSVKERSYSQEQKAYIARCHRDWASQANTKNKGIPFRELAELFNDEFGESPLRSESSISSLVSRDAALSKLRSSLR